MPHRACGATICNRTDELKESDVGTRCGLFEIRKHGDEYFMYLVECKEPKACTIVLRGASKDILKEVHTYTAIYFTVTHTHTHTTFSHFFADTQANEMTNQPTRRL